MEFLMNKKIIVLLATLISTSSTIFSSSKDIMFLGGAVVQAALTNNAIETKEEKQTITTGQRLGIIGASVAANILFQCAANSQASAGEGLLFLEILKNSLVYIGIPAYVRSQYGDGKTTVPLKNILGVFALAGFTYLIRK